MRGGKKHAFLSKSIIQNFVLENFSTKTNRMTLYPTAMEVLVNELSFFFFLLEIRLRQSYFTQFNKVRH